jgi:hypothetical protein
MPIDMLLNISKHVNMSVRGKGVIDSLFMVRSL